MGGIKIYNQVQNQYQAPAIYEDVIANRPLPGFLGRLFVATDTKELQRDTGSGYDVIGGPGSGSITGAGTANKLAKFSSASVITDSIISESGAAISVAGSVTATSFITVSGLNSQFVKGDGSLDSSVYITASSSSNLTNKTGNISQWTNNVGYLTSYTETDTLATVTARGSSTSVLVNFNGGLTATTGNFTGNLNSDLTISGQNVAIQNAAGTERVLVWRTLLVERFSCYLDGVAETGSNAGSNWHLRRFADDGTSLGDVITVTRSTGVVQFTMNISLPGTTGQYIRGDGSPATFPTNVSVFVNDAGYITASSSSNLTNKTGNISQWTNDSAYITSSSSSNLTNKTGNISQWTNNVGYLTSYTETDTLATVTARGNTTATNIQITNGSVLSTVSSAGTVTCAVQSDNTAGYLSTLSAHPLRLRANSTTVLTLLTDTTAEFVSTAKALRIIGNSAADNGVDTIQSGGGSILGNLYRYEGTSTNTGSVNIDRTATFWKDDNNGSTTYTLGTGSTYFGAMYLFFKAGTGTLTLSGSIVNRVGASVGSLALTTASGMAGFYYNGTSYYQLF